MDMDMYFRTFWMKGGGGRGKSLAWMYMYSYSLDLSPSGFAHFYFCVVLWSMTGEK